MNKTIHRFEVALSANDFNGIEEAWLKQLEEKPDDIQTFLQMAEKLAERKEKRRAADLLLTCLDPLNAAGKHAEAYRILLAAIDHNPKERDKKYWDELIALVPKVFADFPEIDKIIANGRDLHDERPVAFLNYLQTFTAFRPGDYVEHTSGWGVGQVVDVQPTEGKLVVDFINKAGHKFALEAAGRMLNRLDAEHFLVWKTYRLEQLRAKCKDEPVEVLKTALRSERNRQLTQRDVKNRLVSDVMDQKTWSKFLTVIKKAAQKDEFIRIGNGQNPTFTLLEEAQTFTDASLERFIKPGTWEEKLERARNILAQISDHDHNPDSVVPALVAYFLKCVDGDKEANRPSGLAAILVLEEIRDNAKNALADVEDALPTLDLYFDADDPQRYIHVLEDIPVGKYQREALARVADFAPTSFAETLKQAFFSESQALWEEALKQCENGGMPEIFEQFGDAVCRDATDFPDNFMWFVKQVFNRQRDTADSTERYKLFEKVLVLASRLQHKFGRGDKNAKVSLQKLKTVLSEDNNALLRDIVKDLTPDQAAHLYNHIGSCTALGNTLPPKLRRKLRQTHPSVEAPVEIEEIGYSIDPTISLTTERGLTRQQRKLKDLMDQLDDNAKALGAAIEMGDISENAEYDAAREKESRLKNQIAEVNTALKSVKMLTSESVDTDHVTPGCRVTFRDEQTDELETKIILGIWDSDVARGIISYKAPLAEALLGHKIGDVVTIIASQGHRPVRIEKIENALLDEDELWGDDDMAGATTTKRDADED